MADAANAANDVTQGGVGEVGRGVMKIFHKRHLRILQREAQRVLDRLLQFVRFNWHVANMHFGIKSSINLLLSVQKKIIIAHQ